MLTATPRETFEERASPYQRNHTPGRCGRRVSQNLDAARKKGNVDAAILIPGQSRSPESNLAGQNVVRLITVEVILFGRL